MNLFIFFKTSRRELDIQKGSSGHLITENNKEWQSIPSVSGLAYTRCAFISDFYIQPGPVLVLYHTTAFWARRAGFLITCSSEHS